MKVEQKSAAEMIAQKIRDFIMDGTLKAGDKVKETELSKLMNVSRTPVREAFRILQSEGYLFHNPRCGVVVTSIKEVEIEHLYEVRSVLEQLAAYQATDNITEEELEELKIINEKFVRYSDFNAQTMCDLDYQFHMLLAHTTGNTILEEQLAILCRKTIMILQFIPFKQERVSETYKEHLDVINAITMHENEIAKKYMEIHFMRSVKSLKNKAIKYNEQLIH